MAVVETAMTTLDVETQQEGQVTELLVDIGTTVPVGTPMVRIIETEAEIEAVPADSVPVPQSEAQDR